MSDFPRGWTLSSGIVAGAAVATITVPAIAGVVHVLDGFLAKAFGTAALSTSISLSSSDGVFSGLVLGVISMPASGTDEASGSSLDLAAGPGASLTVTFNGNAVGDDELIVIQGHDI